MVLPCWPMAYSSCDGWLRQMAFILETLMHTTDPIVERLLGHSGKPLDPSTVKVAQHIARRKHISRNLEETSAAQASLGQRAADAVATFGGSWTFVGLFAATMLAWVGVNAVLLWLHGSTFDPYPYILLNLFLSMLASIQAPIILMSQNRESERDRIRGEHDYEVNLKAELEIMMLHEKLDQLQQQQWTELIALQREQLALLGQIAAKDTPGCA